MNYPDRKERTKFIKLYKDFRKELDKMCVPLIIDNEVHTLPIVYQGNIVGIIVGSDYYIDCVYIEPKYRRLGLAKEAVLKYVKDKLSNGIHIHIINNNHTAYAFWNSLFELVEVEKNAVDTLYIIAEIK